MAGKDSNKGNTPQRQKSILSFFSKTASPFQNVSPLSVNNTTKARLDEESLVISSDNEMADTIPESTQSMKSPCAKVKGRLLSDSSINAATYSTPNTERSFDRMSSNKKSSKRNSRMIMSSDEEDEKENKKEKIASPFLERLSAFKHKSPNVKEPIKVEKSAKEEERYTWLVDVRDKNMNRPGDEGYDKRTLYIPESAQKKFTPFEKQFWDIKSNHYDKVVFFKKGKFYELYETDAEIGTKEFDLKLTDRVNMKMVGVPELSFEMWASKFIAKGYKVAKVDQMETSIGKTIREKNEKQSKEEKIIRRELTCILTGGTLTDSKFLESSSAVYCMSIKELSRDEKTVEYGICFADISTGKIYLSHIQDEVLYKTKLETLIVQVKPKEIVHSRNNLSASTMTLLKNNLPISTIWNVLIDKKEFWDELKTSSYLEEKGVSLPQTTEPITISAFGGLISYLQSLKLDESILQLKNIMAYDVLNSHDNDYLILDGPTLINLEILETKLGKGSLLQVLDLCVTPFGKRLFKQWLCHPLKKVSKIKERTLVIQELDAIQQELSEKLKKLPDLERQICRIHSQSIKIKEFFNVVNSFKYLAEIVSDWKQEFQSNGSDQRSLWIKTFINEFPNIEEMIEPYIGLQVADGKIIPKKGLDAAYDEAKEQVESMEHLLEDYLKEQKKVLRCENVQYKDIGKEVYQRTSSMQYYSNITVEVPEQSWSRIPEEYQLMSQTKTVRRYWSPKLRGFVKTLLERKEILNIKSEALYSQILSKFDMNYKSFLKAVEFIAELDCFWSLKQSVNVIGVKGECCFPEWVENTASAEFSCTKLRHPCISSEGFITNDVSLGGSSKPMILLTGPNMGGKSTLLRQTCIAIIMAQLGGYVPAESCRLSPVDRIFTRIGAHDNIMQGQSTFMVELIETSKILQGATSHSMVILDELGRGTSTFDGYAIAYSVFHSLLSQIQCIGLFATHYHQLTVDFALHEKVLLGHMSCAVSESDKTVTFLYKLKEGSSSKSYGMHVAHMAGIPMEIVDRAIEIGNKFESVSPLYENGWMSFPLYKIVDAYNKTIKL